MYTWNDFAGAPRVAQAIARLPLLLVLRPCMPVKNAAYKITIDTNKPPVNLGDLFSGECVFCLSYNSNFICRM